MTPEEIKKMIEENAEAFEALKKEMPALAQKHVDPMVKAVEENVTKAMEAFETKIEEGVKKQETMEAEMALLKTMPGSQEAEALQLEHDYEKVMNKVFKGERLTSGDQELVAKAQAEWIAKDQIAGNPSEGGLTVMPTFSNQITQKRFESSPMRQLSTVISISSEEWIDWYDPSDVEVEKVAETQARTETDGVLLNEVRIPIHDKAAEIPVSRKLLRSSSISWPAYLQNKVGARMARSDNTDFVAGDGNLGAKGILSYASGTGFNQLEQIDINTVTYEDMVDLQDSLFDIYQQNASFLMRRATRTLLRKLVDDQSRPLWEPSLQQGVPPLFFGAPVLAAADMEAPGGTNKSIAYGDFRESYTIVDRVGLEIVIDEITDTRYKIFKFAHAVGGGVTNFDALKIGVQSA